MASQYFYGCQFSFVHFTSSSASFDVIYLASTATTMQDIMLVLLMEHTNIDHDPFFYTFKS